MSINVQRIIIIIKYMTVGYISAQCCLSVLSDCVVHAAVQIK
jgi:hypothetical protein